MNPTFSIIVPIYNPIHYQLDECVNSIIAQTFQDWEAVLIDDGSDDPSFEVPADHRIKRLRQANAGVSSARNLGIAHATGIWAVFLDADDKLNPEYLSAMHAALTAETDGAYGDVDLLWEIGAPTNAPQEIVYGQHDDLHDYLCTNPIAVTSLVCRVKDIRDAGGFRREYAGTSEDWDLHLRMTRGRSFKYAPSARFVYRLHAYSNTRRIQRMYLGTRMMLESQDLNAEQRSRAVYWLKNWAVRESRAAKARGDSEAENWLLSRPELWKWWLVRRLRP